MSLRYAFRTGADTWDTDTTVDDVGDAGRFISIAITSGGQLLIAYQSGFDPGSLRFAFLNGVTWTIEDVDSAANVGITSSLALDINGDPRIAYHDDTNQHLKYAVRTGNGYVGGDDRRQ